MTSTWRDVIYKGNDNYWLEATSNPVAVSRLPGHAGFVGRGDSTARRPWPTNTWTFLTETYNGSALDLYVNGTLVSSLAQTGNILTSTNPLQIGGDSIYGQYFQGMIDEVRVYNVALTAVQIQSDMNTPIAPDTQPPTAPTNLTATASAGQINLSWTASTDNVGVTGYLIEREDPGSSSFTADWDDYEHDVQRHENVLAGNTYSYRVRATDAAGNLSPYSNPPATATAGFGISPHVATLTLTQTQQFTANSTGVTWSVDGVAGGSPTTGTITSTGLYTAPNSIGTHTVKATTSVYPNGDTATVNVTNYPGTFTYHNDNSRTGVNPERNAIDTGQRKFGDLRKTFHLRARWDDVCLAPLRGQREYPGRDFHNVVYVATEHDSVYAFDADGLSSTPLWQVSFINPAAGVTPVPAADTGETGDIPNEIGITGTPVIDPTTGTLYVVAATKEVSGSTTNYVQRLHALDITTGAEKFGGPVVIQGSVPGTGLGSQGGQLPFDALRENQRTGLLLANGVVYFGFSSHGDVEPFHGWVMGYNATTLQQVLLYCDTANADDGGVWMDGDGIATDSTGKLFYITGDGGFDANTGGTDFGDSFVRMSTAGSVLDYFTPSVQSTLDANNLDLGAGGVLLLPDQSGAHPHEMISAGKNGTIYLVDRDNMGHYDPSQDHIVQELVNIFPNNLGQEGGNFGSPVYFNGSVYFAPVQGAVQAFSLTNGLLSTASTSHSSEVYGSRGGTMAISANGTTNGILWTLQSTGSSSPGVLHAYNATNLSQRTVQQQPSGVPRHTRYLVEVQPPARGEWKGVRRRRQPTDGVWAAAERQRRADGQCGLDTGADPSQHERVGQPGFRRLFGRPSGGGFGFHADATIHGEPRQWRRHGDGDHAGSVAVESYN